MPTHKRSQVEIVGLLIIVIMISFVLLFSLKSFIKPHGSVVDTYGDETLASSVISALLSTSTDCTANDIDMEDLLLDCIRWRSHSYGNIMCSNGMDSCEFFENRTKMIFDTTLNQWKESYELVIIGPEGNFEAQDTWEFHLMGGNFSDDGGSATTQPLPLSNYGSINIQFCIGGCGYS